MPPPSLPSHSPTPCLPNKGVCLTPRLSVTVILGKGTKSFFFLFILEYEKHLFLLERWRKHVRH